MISNVGMFHKFDGVTIEKFCDPTFVDHETARDAFVCSIVTICIAVNSMHVCFFSIGKLYHLTWKNIRKYGLLLHMYHIEQWLAIYCSLLATLPTDNFIFLSLYFSYLWLTASLATVHSCTISDCYDSLHPTLKFAIWIWSHTVFAIKWSMTDLPLQNWLQNNVELISFLSLHERTRSKHQIKLNCKW